MLPMFDHKHKNHYAKKNTSTYQKKQMPLQAAKEEPTKFHGVDMK